MIAENSPKQVKRCPKTGKIISEPMKQKKRSMWENLTFAIVGIASLIWFLIRVIPKPSRAKYPCMRVAAPAAASFVTWLLGVISLAASFNKFKKLVRETKYIKAISVMTIGIICVLLFSASSGNNTTNAATTPDAPNSPIGIGKGIFPGRVTWSRNLSATTWDGSTGYWWENKNTNQSLVDGMVSNSIQSLTGTNNDSASWEAIFKYFNQNHGKGNIGYNNSEKIAIKINCNNTRDSHTQQVNNINPSPQLLLSILRQLINTAGVPQGNIIAYDASRYIADNIYTYCKNEFPNVIFVDQNGGDGRVARVWSEPIIQYSEKNYCGDRIPTVVAEANYLIDMPIMKAHPMAGMTLSAKNHYGTINGLDHTLARPYNTYNPFVDFMGDKDLGGKTLLNVLDGLYGAKHSDAVPEKWKSKPFNGTWAASVFMSLDQVALDSVGFDFLNAEMGANMMTNSDSYLHEEALANNPPSGVVYAPDGVRLNSLGVHEHWNNADEKKYTRNLGTGNGIELVTIGGSDIPVDLTPTIPGKIEAEDYNAMNGIQTQGCSEGTLNIGWVDAGDWMDYNIKVSKTGTYTVKYRVSSPVSTAKVQLKSGENVLATTDVPNTGGWQTWQTVDAAVNLTEGNQTLRVYAAAKDFNINWIDFELAGSNPDNGNTKSKDVNKDGTVDIKDLELVSQLYNMKNTDTGFIGNYDFNDDNIVDLYDLVIVAESSPKSGVMDFVIQNGTRGIYSDNQIYWGVIGLNKDDKWCYLDENGELIPISTALNDAPGHLTKNGKNYANIYHTISERPITSIPAISSGRMFLSVGSPCYIKTYDNGYAGPDVNNPTDPNNDVYWDFVEFTLDAGGYHGNTTRVDAFGFPITHRLICSDGYDRTVGETETRDALFEKYLKEVPEEFKTLVRAPYRILAPCKGEFKAGGIYGNYFDTYVNQVWKEAGPKPTTQDIFLGIGGASDPDICAAFNRGVYTDPTHWKDAGYFYKTTPSNFYSKFWHDHSIDGLSYGFCYDDVNNYAAYLEHNNPETLIITVGW